MNAPFKSPHGKATIFTSNRSQAVRLPKAVAFPDGVKELRAIPQGKGLLLVPVESLWDDFFDRPGIDIRLQDDVIDDSVVSFD